jgi:hypothetical protein
MGGGGKPYKEFFFKISEMAKGHHLTNLIDLFAKNVETKFFIVQLGVCVRSSDRPSRQNQGPNTFEILSKSAVRHSRNVNNSCRKQKSQKYKTIKCVLNTFNGLVLYCIASRYIICNNFA